MPSSATKIWVYSHAEYGSTAECWLHVQPDAGMIQEVEQPPKYVQRPLERILWLYNLWVCVPNWRPALEAAWQNYTIAIWFSSSVLWNKCSKYVVEQ